MRYYKSKSQISKSKKRRLRRNRCKLEAEKHPVIQDSVTPHHSLDDAHHPSDGCLATQRDLDSCHDPPADQPLTDDGVSVVSQADDLDITLCRDNPSAVISPSQLSQSDLPVLSPRGKRHSWSLCV